MAQPPEADEGEMVDAEGHLLALAAPHADGVAAGIIAAAHEAAMDAAELPAPVQLPNPDPYPKP